MQPQNPTDYPSAKIYSFNGIDRIQTEMNQESDPAHIFYFPYIQSSLINAINVIDSQVGGLTKRSGSVTYLDNPDNQPIQAMIQYTNATGGASQIRVSGNSLYIYRYSGSSWNTPINVPDYVTSSVATTGSVGANILASTTYYYKVTAINANGETTGSTETFVATGATAHPITIQWHTVQPASGYKIYKSTASGGEQYLATVTQTPGSPSAVLITYTDSGSTATTSSTVPTSNTALGPQWILTGNNIRMRHASIYNLLFLSNGVDPLLFYDGSNIYPLTNNNVSTTLTAALNATDTSISVASTAGFPPTGFLQIGTEFIMYASKTNTTFVGLGRAIAYSTTPSTAYPIGTSVNVYYGSPPVSPKVVYPFENRLYTANSISEASTIRYSGVYSALNGLYWFYYAKSLTQNSTVSVDPNITPGQDLLDPGSSGIAVISPNDGQQVKGMNSTNGLLFVGKNQSSHLDTPDNFGRLIKNTEISRQYGTFSQESIVNQGGTIFYFNEYGVMSTDSTSPMLQSYQIQDLAQGIPYTNLSSICGIKHNFVLYYSIGSTTESAIYGGNTYNNAVLVYNFLTAHWFMYLYPFTINAYSEMFDAGGTLQLYYGDTNGNTYMYEQGIYQDAGIDIAVDIQTRYYFFKSPTKFKDYRVCTVITDDVGGGELHYSLVSDHKTDWSFLTDLPNYIQTGDFPASPRTGKGIAYRVIETSAAPFYFKGIEQEYEEVSF